MRAQSGSAKAALAVFQTGGGPLIIAHNMLHGELTSLDSAGNLIVKGSATGTIFHPVASPTPLAVQRTATGTTVSTYSPRQSVPTMEDVGEAQLVNGQTYVRLEPTFASATIRGSVISSSLRRKAKVPAAYM